MKKTFNFNIPVTGLDGLPAKEIINQKNAEPIERDIMLGTGLAMRLAQSQTGDALKLSDWAMTVYRGEPLELDVSDSETLIRFIKDLEMQAIIKAQLLVVTLKS